jgi:dephospho-CoA kinase
MYKIGITGSIGTGKTTIANVFALFKIPIFDADREIKKILKKKEIKQKLKNIWPLIVKKEQIDKLKLRQIIFSNNVEKNKLEKLLYPYLEIELKMFEAANDKRSILVYDVPLIYETKTEKRYDKILLAHCNKKVQKERVLARDKISNSLFEKILASQLSFDDKIKFKPQVINTKNKFFILIKVSLLLIKILIRLKLKNGKKKINT